jgi:hypothetical protein
MSVHLHIERLLVDGDAIDHRNAAHWQRALEQSLAALIAEPAVSARLRGLSTLQVDTLSAPRGTPQARAGTPATPVRLAERIVGNVLALGTRGASLTGSRGRS